MSMTSVPLVSHAENLTGEWLLVGAMPSYFVPNTSNTTNVSASFTVNGKIINGSAQIDSVCSAGGAFAHAYVGVIGGTVNEDGTFAATLSSTDIPVQSLTIQGTAPTSMDASWIGKVSYTNAGGNGQCAASFSNSFTAVSVPSIAGNFSGSGSLVFAQVPSGPPPAQGVPYSITASLAQGSPGAQSPITGSVQLAGFPCFATGTAIGSYSNIESNIVNLSFTMNDGASVQLAASVNNTAGTQLAVSGIYVRGDGCAGNYFVATDPSVITNPLLLNQ